MIHIIYISIIIGLFYQLVKAYHFANKKHKESEVSKRSLITYKETVKVPYQIFSHYEKAYVNFYKWLVEIKADKKIIDKFDKLFKYDEDI